MDYLLNSPTLYTTKIYYNFKRVKLSLSTLLCMLAYNAPSHANIQNHTIFYVDNTTYKKTAKLNLGKNGLCEEESLGLLTQEDSYSHVSEKASEEGIPLSAHHSFSGEVYTPNSSPIRLDDPYLSCYFHITRRPYSRVLTGLGNSIQVKRSRSNENYNPKQGVISYEDFASGGLYGIPRIEAAITYNKTSINVDNRSVHLNLFYLNEYGQWIKRYSYPLYKTQSRVVKIAESFDSSGTPSKTSHTTVTEMHLSASWSLPYDTVFKVVAHIDDEDFDDIDDVRSKRYNVYDMNVSFDTCVPDLASPTGDCL